MRNIEPATESTAEQQHLLTTTTTFPHSNHHFTIHNNNKHLIYGGIMNVHLNKTFNNSHYKHINNNKHFDLTKTMLLLPAKNVLITTLKNIEMFVTTKTFNNSNNLLDCQTLNNFIPNNNNTLKNVFSIQSKHKIL